MSGCSFDASGEERPGPIIPNTNGREEVAGYRIKITDGTSSIPSLETEQYILSTEISSFIITKISLHTSHILCKVFN